MPATLRIAQISDCHLPASPEIDYRGINAYANLELVLAKVREFGPDLVIASGDLSEDASASSYVALKNYLELLRVPVLALPGNHDLPDAVAETFPGSPVEDIAITEHGDWQIIRLNSCMDGRPEGRLSSSNLQQLERILNTAPERPRIIVLHHQPVAVGSPWIDKYCLQEPEDFLQLVDANSSVKAVLWGHVHQEFELVRDKTQMLAGPSSAINSLSGNEKFTPDPRGTGFRWLLAAPHGELTSGVVWGQSQVPESTADSGTWL